MSDTARVLWLPSIGRPVQVSVPGLGVDPGSGDLVVPVDAAVPDRCTVTGDVARFDALDLRSAVGEPARGSASYDVPASLTRAAQGAVAGTTTSFGRLAALESFFATSGGFGVAPGPDAPAGHGIFQISRLLKEKTGTAEQYSSAFAVLARVLGFDSRVVIGFRATTETSGALCAAPRLSARGRSMRGRRSGCVTSAGCASRRHRRAPPTRRSRTAAPAAVTPTWRRLSRRSSRRAAVDRNRRPLRQRPRRAGHHGGWWC